MLRTMELSPQAFWDVKMENLDEEEHADWIIVRVFEWGTWDDLLEVWVFYGDKKVKNALVNAPYLTEQTWLFAASLFKLNPSDFRCSTTKQLHPIARSYSVN